MSKTSLTKSTEKRTPANRYNGLVMTLPNGESFHLGYSRISKFVDCPKQFKLTYVDKIKDEGGVPLRRGQAYHGAVETLLQYKIDHPDKHYSLNRAERLAIRQGKLNNLTDAEIYRVIDAVRYYHTTLYGEHKPLAVEEAFEIVRGGVKLTGRVDLLETVGTIVDHKFSYDTWAESRARYGCQPIIYQWAALDLFEKKFPGWKYRGFEYNVIRLYPNPRIQRIEVPKLDQDASDWWEEQIHQYARTIRRGFFPATPSDKVCTFCPHKKICKPVIYNVRMSNIGEDDHLDDEDC